MLTTKVLYSRTSQKKFMARYSPSYVKQQIMNTRGQPRSQSTTSVVVMESAVPFTRNLPSYGEPDYYRAVGLANEFRIQRKLVALAKPKDRAEKEAQLEQLRQTALAEGYTEETLLPYSTRYRYIPNPSQYAGSNVARPPPEVKYSQPGSLTGGGVTSKTGTAAGVGLSEGFYVGNKGEQVYVTKGSKASRTAAQGVAALNRTIEERPGEAAAYGLQVQARERTNIQNRKINQAITIGSNAPINALNLPRQAVNEQLQTQMQNKKEYRYEDVIFESEIREGARRLAGYSYSAEESLTKDSYYNQNPLVRYPYKGASYVYGALGDYSQRVYTQGIRPTIVKDVAIGYAGGYAFGKGLQLFKLGTAYGAPAIGTKIPALAKAGSFISQYSSPLTKGTEIGLATVGVASFGYEAVVNPQSFRENLGSTIIQGVSAGIGYQRSLSEYGGARTVTFSDQQYLDIDQRSMARFRQQPSLGLTGSVKTRATISEYGVITQNNIPVEGSIIIAGDYTSPRRVVGEYTTQFDVGGKFSPPEQGPIAIQFDKKLTTSVMLRPDNNIYIQTISPGRTGGRLGDVRASKANIVELEFNKDINTYQVIKGGTGEVRSVYNPYTRSQFSFRQNKDMSASSLRIDARILNTQGISSGNVFSRQAGQTTAIESGYGLGVRTGLIRPLTPKTASEPLFSDLLASRRGATFIQEYAPSQTTMPRPYARQITRLYQPESPVLVQVPTPMTAQKNRFAFFLKPASAQVPRVATSPRYRLLPRIAQSPRISTPTTPRYAYSPIQEQIATPVSRFAQSPVSRVATTPISRLSQVTTVTTAFPIILASPLQPIGRGPGLPSIKSQRGGSLTQLTTRRSFGYSRTLYEIEFGIGGRSPKKVRGGYTGFELTRSTRKKRR